MSPAFTRPPMRIVCLTVATATAIGLLQGASVASAESAAPDAAAAKVSVVLNVERAGPITVTKTAGKINPDPIPQVAVLPGGAVDSGRQPFLAIPRLMQAAGPAPSTAQVRVIDVAAGDAVRWTGTLTDGWGRIGATLPEGRAYRVEAQDQSRAWQGVGWFVVRSTSASAGPTSSIDAISISQVTGDVTWGWQSRSAPGPITNGSISMGWSSRRGEAGAIRDVLPQGLPAGWHLGADTGSQWAGLVEGQSGVVSVIGWDGTVLVFERNASGVYVQRTGGTDGFSNTVQRAGSGWEFIDTQGVVTQFSGSGRLFRVASVTSDTHRLTETLWDSAGRLVRVVNSAGRAIDLVYNDSASSCESSAWTAYGFAAPPAGKLCRVVYPGGLATDFGYVAGAGESAQIALVKEASNIGTSLAWDSLGRLVGDRGSLATLVESVDPEASEVRARLTYDAKGRAAVITAVTGGVESITFPTITEAVLKAWVIDPDRAATSDPVIVRDSLDAGTYVTGKRTWIDPISWTGLDARDNNGGSFDSILDERGRITSARDSQGRVMTYEYNALDLVTKTTGPSAAGERGTVVSQQYDTVPSRTRSAGADATPMAGLRALVGTGARRANEFWPASRSRGGLTYVWSDRPADWSGEATGVWTPSDSDDTAARAAGGWRFSVLASGAQVQFRVGARMCVTDSSGTCEMRDLPAGIKQVTVAVVRAKSSGWFEVRAAAIGETPVPLANGTVAPGYGLQTSTSTNDTFPGRDTAPRTVTAYADPSTGQASSITSPGGLITSYTYETDGWGRLLTSTTPGGEVESTSYWPDRGTAVVPEVCGGGTVDVSGQVRAITRTDGSSVKTWYDITGAVVATQRTGAGSAVQTTCLTYFDDWTLASSATYNSDSVLIERVVRDEAVDGDPRVTRTTITQGPAAAVGGLSSITMTARRNVRGQVVEEIGSSGTRTSYSYDASGALTSTTSIAPSGERFTVVRAYSSLDGSLTSVSINGVVAAKVSYDNAGRLLAVEYARGIKTTYSYNALGSLMRVVHRAAGRVWSDSVERTAYGRVTSQSLERPGADEARTYAYDPGSGRLDRAVILTGDDRRVDDYDYADRQDPSCAGDYASPGADALRTGGRRDGVAYVSCHDSKGRLVSTTDPVVTGGSGTAHFNYDAFGRVTSILGVDRPVSIAWGRDGEVASVREGSGADQLVIRNDYFGGGLVRRTVSSASGSSTVQFSGPFVIEVKADGTLGAVTATQYSLPGGVQITSSARGAATATLPGVDGAAVATIEIPRGTGELVTANADRFGAYGEPLSAPAIHGASPERHYGWQTASGQESLPGTSSISILGARAYLPGTGEFLSTDTKIDGGANLYGYTSGDPINFSDTSGGSEESNDLAAKAFIVGFLSLFTSGMVGMAGMVFQSQAFRAVAVVAGAVAGGAGAIAAAKASQDGNTTLLVCGIVVSVLGLTVAASNVSAILRSAPAREASQFARGPRQARGATTTADDFVDAAAEIAEAADEAAALAEAGDATTRILPSHGGLATTTGAKGTNVFKSANALRQIEAGTVKGVPTAADVAVLEASVRAQKAMARAGVKAEGRLSRSFKSRKFASRVLANPADPVI